MRNEFREDRRTIAVDFDYNAVYLALGEAEDKLPDRDWEALMEAISAVFDWALNIIPRNRREIQWLGRRAMVLAWVLFPDKFAGVSLRMLGRRVTVAPQTLSRIAAEAARYFAIRNRSQIAHGWRGRQRAQPRRAAGAKTGFETPAGVKTPLGPKVSQDKPRKKISSGTVRIFPHAHTIKEQKQTRNHTATLTPPYTCKPKPLDPSQQSSNTMAIPCARSGVKGMSPSTAKANATRTGMNGFCLMS